MRKSILKATAIAATTLTFTVLGSMSVFAGISEATVTSVTAKANAKFANTIRLTEANSYNETWISDGTLTNGIENGTCINVSIGSGCSNGTKAGGKMFNDTAIAYTNGVILAEGNTGSITVTVKKAGTVVVDYAGDGNKKGPTFTDGTNSVHPETGVNGGGIQTYFDVDATDLASGDYTFNINKTEASYIYAIGFISASTDPELNLDKNSISVKPTESDTVTATLRNSNETITALSSNNDVATCSVSGNIITITGAAGAAADSTATITVSAGTLEETVTVTILAENAAETYTLSGNSLSSATLSADENAGTKNMFLVKTGTKNTSGSIVIGDSPAGVKFKVASNSPADSKIILKNAKGGSDSKQFYIKNLTDGTSEAIAVSKTAADKEYTLTAGKTYEVCKSNTGLTIESFSVTGILEALPAAEVTKTANAANPAVIACDDGNYYAIAVVSKDDLTKSSISFKKGETAVLANITKVYESIKVNGKETLTASDFTSASGDYYVVAAKINGVDEEASTAISNIAALTVEVVE